MKCLVTGAEGQLGHEVICELRKRGYDSIGTSHVDMDITDPQATAIFIQSYQPNVVVHCAAYTAVDRAEDEPDKCIKVNANGTENIAIICGELGIPLLYISTDYVFNGEGMRPWEPDDTCFAPLNVYGQSKYKGELVVKKYCQKYFIVRISWAFGLNIQPNHGSNFVNTMLQIGSERGAVSVVNDQIGSPTYMYDLARLLVDMLETRKYGVYHATNEGYCSWYEFACEIFRQAGLRVTVSPLTSEQYPAKAKRPHNSRMNKDKLNINGFQRLPTWQDALSRYLKEYLNKG